MNTSETLHRQKEMLKSVKTLVAHQKQITEIKGESFNVFNILNLKTNEVRTHSAFIAELLNPNGSHLMKSAFLNAFIELLPIDVFKNHLDIKTTEVFIEFYAGLIKIEKDLKTGGRIDILIKDNAGKTISIENKIDAGDQEFQIERYCNYNKENNKVIYLSKDGKEPDISSKGELQKDLNYHLISYNIEIIDWLQTCQRIAYDQPLLRESIKQYRILIQQITNTLEDKEDKQLTAIVKDNLEEASLIASKYEKVVGKLRENFRDQILEILHNDLKDFVITKNGINRKPAHIWFHRSGKFKANFGVESFNGNWLKNDILYIGIFDSNNILPNRIEFLSINKQWVHHQPLLYNNKEISLSDNSFLNKISNPDILKEIADIVANQIMNFIAEHRVLVEI